MDYHKFDKYSDDSESNYAAFVEWLEQITAAELRQTRNDSELRHQALCRYYKRGLQANLSPGELVDFLGVSTPSILDRAGYDDEQGDAVMAMAGILTEEDIDRITLNDG